MTTPKPTGIGKLFAAVCLIEGLTWTGLLIGMFLKHTLKWTDMGVWLFGRLHGAAFIIYLVVAVLAALRLRWPWQVALGAILAAFPPLVTIPLEIWLKRRGMLTEAPAAS
jgi:integral membrane protein